MTFEERCRLSEQCLPEAPYREMLTKLHNEILATLAQPEQEPCGGCGGSGWVSRDPDIGTDQECFVCEGAGVIKPQQEPVAWMHTDGLGGIQAFTNEPPPSLKAKCRPLIFGDTSPPQRKPLTDEEILYMCTSVPDYDIGNHDLIQFARAIEASHGIKENT